MLGNVFVEFLPPRAASTDAFSELHIWVEVGKVEGVL